MEISERLIWRARYSQSRAILVAAESIIGDTPVGRMCRRTIEKDDGDVNNESIKKWISEYTVDMARHGVAIEDEFDCVKCGFKMTHLEAGFYDHFCVALHPGRDGVLRHHNACPKCRTNCMACGSS